METGVDGCCAFVELLFIGPCVITYVLVYIRAAQHLVRINNFNVWVPHYVRVTEFKEKGVLTPEMPC